MLRGEKLLADHDGGAGRGGSFLGFLSLGFVLDFWISDFGFRISRSVVAAGRVRR